MLDDQIALGPGKADLLDAIHRTGSISAAAKLMRMSYRRAWMLVDTMNKCFNAPLVESTTGGAGGGGASVTEAGLRLLSAYRKLQEDIASIVETRLSIFEGELSKSNQRKRHQAH